MTGPALTIAEAAPMLNPPITERDLRDIVRALHIQPCSRRHTGRTGKPAHEYDWGEIVKLHAALAPWLTRLTLCCALELAEPLAGVAGGADDLSLGAMGAGGELVDDGCLKLVACGFVLLARGLVGAGEVEQAG